MRFFWTTFALLAATAAANDCGNYHEDKNTGGNEVRHPILDNRQCTRLRQGGEQPNDLYMQYWFYVKSECIDCTIWR
jgi:hypothetical protein